MPNILHLIYSMYFETYAFEGSKMSVTIKINEILMWTAKTYEKCCKDRTVVEDGNNFSVFNDVKQQN